MPAGHERIYRRALGATLICHSEDDGCGAGQRASSHLEEGAAAPPILAATRVIHLLLAPVFAASEPRRDAIAQTDIRMVAARRLCDHRWTVLSSQASTGGSR